MVNGSIKNFHLQEAFEELEDSVSANWGQIGRTASAMYSLVLPEGLSDTAAALTKLRYGRCDVDANNEIKGKAEWSCLSEALLSDVAGIIRVVARNIVPRDAVDDVEQWVKDQRLIQLALILGTQKGEDLDTLLTGLSSFHSSNTKFLQVIEEAISSWGAAKARCRLSCFLERFTE